MKTLKTIFTTAVLSVIFLLATGCVIAQSLTDLPGEGQVSTKTWLEKNGEVIELTFDYQAGNTTQRDYYQVKFDKIYADLKTDGFKPTEYHDHRQGEVDITICPTYYEDDAVLGTYFYAESYGILQRDDSTLSTIEILTVLKKKSAEQVAFQKAAKKDKGFE